MTAVHLDLLKYPLLFGREIQISLRTKKMMDVFELFGVVIISKLSS